MNVYFKRSGNFYGAELGSSILPYGEQTFSSDTFFRVLKESTEKVYLKIFVPSLFLIFLFLFSQMICSILMFTA